MFKQEVCSQNLDDIVSKMHTLITNQGEWAAKSRQDKFVKELCHDCCGVGLQSFGLHSFGSIIGCHQNIAIIYVMTCWFDGAYEINAPFCERFNKKHCGQLNQTSVDQIVYLLAIITRSAMVHNILVKHRPPIFNNQFFSNCDIYQKMTSTYPFVYFLEDD
jgi:hypothetical protein